MKLSKESSGFLAVLSCLLEKIFDKVNRFKNVSIEHPSFILSSENSYKSTFHTKQKNKVSKEFQGEAKLGWHISSKVTSSMYV